MEKRHLSAKTISLWAFIASNVVEYHNPFFNSELHSDELQPLTAITQLTIWLVFLLSSYQHDTMPYKRKTLLCCRSSYFLRRSFAPHMESLKKQLAQLPPDTKVLRIADQEIPFFPGGLLLRMMCVQVLDIR